MHTRPSDLIRIQQAVLRADAQGGARPEKRARFIHTSAAPLPARPLSLQPAEVFISHHNDQAIAMQLYAVKVDAHAA